MTHIINFIFIFGITITGLVIFMLLKTKKKKISKRILILIFFLCLLNIVYFYSNLHSIKWLHFILFPLNSGTYLLLGPLVFFYTQSIFINKLYWTKIIAHFIPLLFYSIVFSISFSISGFREDYFFDYSGLYENIKSSLCTVFVGYFLIYIVISYRKLLRIKTISNEHYSNLEGYNLSWLKRMFIGAFIIATVQILQIIYSIFINEVQWSFGFPVIILVIILIGYSGYHGAFQSNFMIPTSFIEFQESLIKNKAGRIVTFLKDHELKNIKQSLEQVMEIQKCYLDENLTLNSLANLISTTDKKLSIYLNSYLKTNFYDFVNTYRIIEVKQKLETENFKNYTLLAIAFESGFNSKASFNRIFKKKTGLSPSEYKKQSKILQ